MIGMAHCDGRERLQLRSCRNELSSHYTDLVDHLVLDIVCFSPFVTRYSAQSGRVLHATVNMRSVITAKLCHIRAVISSGGQSVSVRAGEE